MGGMTRKRTNKPPSMPEFEEFIDRPYTTREGRAAAAALPIPERLRIVRRLCAPTPQFKDLKEALRGFHIPVEGGGHDVGKICGLIGPSRSGKSWALGSYIQGLGRMDRTDAIVPRAVYLEASEGGSGRDFASRAYTLLGLGDAPRSGAKWLKDQVREEIVHYRIELVVIDDAQFIFANRVGGTSDILKGFLKDLSNAQTCNIVLAGDQTVEDVVRSISYLEGRGGFPVERVKPYAWSADGKTGAFGKLLDRIDNRLPFLLPSSLSSPAVAAHLYELSGGIIGKLMNVVAAAAVKAIGDGASNVGIDHLRDAAMSRRRLNDPYQPFKTDLPSPPPAPPPPTTPGGAPDKKKPSLNKRRPPRRAA